MELEVGSQIQIRFTTKQDKYAVPDTPLSVSERLSYVHLNKLLNELLVESSQLEKVVEFDFLVLGELLRQPLIDHLRDHNASVEATIEVEYVERTPAPEPQDTLLQDDWISGIQVSGKWILTGCYDNTVNIWTVSGKHQVGAREHTHLIRSVAWLKHDDPSGGFVSVSHDLTGFLWKWDPGTEEVVPCIALRGHERGIDAVSVSPNSEKLVTGGWDTYLKIWSALLEYDDDVEEPAVKKQKGPKRISTRMPLSTLKGHKENIVSAFWSATHTVGTASMDHTIKLWDIELCGLKNEIIGQKAFLGADWSPHTQSIIACSADRHIRLYDPRSNEGAVCKSTFTSHTLWVSAVKWSKHDEHLFMSGSHDECVKLWDTRSPKAPLFDLTGHQGKVLCLDWSNPKYMVSGGTDNAVHVFKNKQYV